MTVLIVVPTWRTPQHMLDRCISSILNQTHKDLCLLVIGDGERPNIRSTDSRLVVHTTEINRGRYFIDGAAQRATPFKWYSPHDADDWSEPDRLENLWQYRESGTVWSDHINHRGSSQVRMSFPRATKPLGPTQKRQACHLGLYRIDRLHATGMYHPCYRVHYDSLHNSLIKMTGPITYSPNAKYHRVKWAGSMTMRPDIGLRTAYREAVAQKCRELYRRAYDLYINGRSDEIARMIQSTIDPATEEAVEYEATRLRKELQ
jgi:glycosyltransferase involved in cell wall biosynthesis